MMQPGENRRICQRTKVLWEARTYGTCIQPTFSRKGQWGGDGAGGKGADGA